MMTCCSVTADEVLWKRATWRELVVDSQSSKAKAPQRQ